MNYLTVNIKSGYHAPEPPPLGRRKLETTSGIQTEHDGDADTVSSTS